MMQFLGLPLLAPILALAAAIGVGLVLGQYVRARRAGSTQATKRLVLGILGIVVVVTVLGFTLLRVIQTVGS